MKVYIAVRLTGESTTSEVETDILGVFSSREKARECIAKKAEHLFGKRFYRDTGDSISAVIEGGWEIDYRYDEYEINQMEEK